MPSSKSRHGHRRRSSVDPSTSTSTSTSTDIPLAHPDRTRSPAQTTLLEIAASRHPQLNLLSPDPDSKDDNGLNLIKLKTDHEGDVEDGGYEGEDSVIPDTLLYAISLSMLHGTFDVLVQNQYTREFNWRETLKRLGVAFPTLFILVYIVRRGKAPSKPSSTSTPLSRGTPQGVATTPGPNQTATRARQALTQLTLFILCVVSGCYVVYASNEEPYYAVMKRTPPLGTLWVWSAIELDLPWILASLVLWAAFIHMGGYSVY
ncbi:MAG: hypothetical protein M1825_003431 [Sarcosagium campestre]|nr:MAG: hypothetical protein M1825_003431 [Sarcosagium campestre]